VLLQSIYSIVQSFPGLLRSPWLLRLLVFLPLLPVFGLFLVSCAKREAAPTLEPLPAVTRGDLVVVEATAAHFFEGRVLAAEGGRLRIQAADGADSVSVALSDVYRLPPPLYEPRAGAFAVCERENTWLPCRIERAAPPAFTAVDATGASFQVDASHLLSPSPLTELNLKRYFAKHEAGLEFKRNAASAGNPKLSPGWRPAKHERLLAKFGGDWLTAYVQELEQDGVSVTRAGSRTPMTLPLSSLAPEPPSSFASDLHRGDFVLVRPESPSDPWSPRIVRSINGDELKIADATGTVKTTSPREVVPLGQ